MIRLGLKKKKKISESLTNKPNSKVPHLALSLKLGNEDHHARPRSDEVIIFHPLVRFENVGNKPNNGRPRLEVIPSISL